METARALRHALRCQRATRRQGREAQLGLVISCRLCGRHWTEEETREGCPACRETMICPGDLHPWIAAVSTDGRPLGNRTDPRDHGNCPDWHPVLAATSGIFRS